MTCYPSFQHQSFTSATFCFRFNNISNSDERSSFYKSCLQKDKNENRFLTHNINLLRLTLLPLKELQNITCISKYDTRPWTGLTSSVSFSSTLPIISPPYNLHSLHKSLWNITFLELTSIKYFLLVHYNYTNTNLLLLLIHRLYPAYSLGVHHPCYFHQNHIIPKSINR